MARTPEEIRGDVGAIETRQLHLQVERRDLLRELARADGRLANTIEELYPEQKLSWEIQESRKSSPIMPQMAYGRVASERLPFPSKIAYCCEGCEGWIKGKPREERFDTIRGAMSPGAAGERLFCTVCEQEVGLIVTKRSG